MSEILNEIYRNCDPAIKSSTEFYVDCREARGGDAFVNEVIENLRKTTIYDERNVEVGQIYEEIDSRSKFYLGYLSFLFTGHIGCGKSSELKHLMDCLEKKENYQTNAKFFPIYIDVEKFLYPSDVSITDILLLVATQFVQILKDVYDVSIEDTYFSRIIKDKKDLLFSETEIKEGKVNLGLLQFKFDRLKSSENARKELRQAFSKKESTMLEELNLLFDKARIALREKHKENLLKHFDIILILDNLDVVERVEDANSSFDSHKKIFIENAPIFTRLKSHVVYTIPLELYREEHSFLDDRYSGSFVLPMIKVVERKNQSKPFPKGIEKIRELVTKRLAGKTVEEVFADGAFDFLVKYSGGNVRYLIRFIRKAVAFSNSLPLTQADIRKAMRENIQGFSGLGDSFFTKLAVLDLDPNQNYDKSDLDYQIMLKNRNIYEYLNGGDEDSFQEDEPWYAVNPIIKELTKFKSERERLLNERKQSVK